MRTDLAGRDVEGFLTEGVAGEDVDEAHDGDEDAGGDDEAPVGLTQGVFRGGGLVEVSENGDAQDDHEDAEGDEARGWGEEGPVVGDVAAEEADLSNDEGD